MKYLYDSTGFLRYRINVANTNEIFKINPLDKIDPLIGKPVTFASCGISEYYNNNKPIPSEKIVYESPSTLDTSSIEQIAYHYRGGSSPVEGKLFHYEDDRLIAYIDIHRRTHKFIYGKDGMLYFRLVYYGSKVQCLQYRTVIIPLGNYGYQEYMAYDIESILEYIGQQICDPKIDLSYYESSKL